MKNLITQLEEKNDNENSLSNFSKNTEQELKYYQTKIILKEPFSLKKYILSPIFLAALTFVVTGLINHNVSTLNNKEHFNKINAAKLDYINNEVNKYNKLLKSFSYLINGNKELSSSSFLKYANSLVLKNDYPSLLRVDYLSYSNKDELDHYYEKLSKDYFDAQKNRLLSEDTYLKINEIIEKNKIINEKSNTVNLTSNKIMLNYTFPLNDNIQLIGDEYIYIDKTLFKTIDDGEIFGSYTYKRFIENSDSALYHTNLLSKIDNGNDLGALSLVIELNKDLFEKKIYAKLNKNINLKVFSSPNDGKRLIYESFTEKDYNKFKDLKPVLKHSSFILIGKEEYEIVFESFDNLFNKDYYIGVGLCLILSILVFAIFYFRNKKMKENDLDSNVMEKIENQLRVDDLTKLLNRRACLQDLQSLINKYKSYVNGNNLGMIPNITLIFIDLDGFKRINDTLGHSYGDYVLIEYGKRLTALLSNIENTSIYRLGGDEFTIVLNNHLEEDVELVVEQILELTKEPFCLQEDNYYVTQSIGVASFPNNSWTTEMLLKNADMAMYEAKKSGKNCCVFFNQKIYEAIDKKNKVVNNINEALEREEFYMVYQPKFRLISPGKYHCSGVEALIRWENEKLGNVRPDVFVPLIEEYGLISQTTSWILNKICEEAQVLKGLKDFKISINLSAKQLSNMGLARDFYNIIKEYNLEPKNFVIEITETTMMKQPEITKISLLKFKELGFTISVDDFGTGYSSLSYLRQFTVDELKIDKSFTDMVLNDHHTQVIVEGIFTMSKKLNLNIVVEGVEKEEQIKWIESNSSKEQIVEIQGYYFSKPLKMHDLKNFLKK